VKAKAKKQTSRGRKQDRARVAGGRDHAGALHGEEDKQVGRYVKKAVKKVGTSRKRVERGLGS
jgi:hypothetical protein